ncbi:cytochrome c biogenesis protein DipZ [Bosea sp. BIWAKO-01]|uniref:cytochrome c biogenesis protein DipZ n=1 Tax=Bosea sp. BIWAKO-01 TaxID=506668 RepID=UPI000853C58D|nr:redoxin family protein [Bosea sp. BIWAKO-01]GAU84674.1 DipZ protein [Bosea sp. BIWAKO-01]
MTLFVIAYLAGALTVVSPCILPILPFVFARADQPFLRSTLPILVGLAASFAGVVTLSAVGGAWMVRANELGRHAAVALLAVFAATLISPRAAALLSRPFVALGERLARGVGSGHGTIGGSLLLGVATGFLWTPCAGPVLGLLLTGAALHGANLETSLLLIAYSTGTATALGLALLAGGPIFAAMRRSLGIGERVRQGLGIAILASIVAIASGLDTGPLARLSYASTNGIEQALLDRLGPDAAAANRTRLADDHSAGSASDARTPHRSPLPDQGAAPGLDGAVAWLNSAPLSAEQRRGKVVLVNFWTYSCINCIRTLPYVRAWAEKYKEQGLLVVGVHAPEFAFEKNIDNVRQAVARFGISHPVAIDNDFRIWRAFGNSYWPALYFIDGQGRIRHRQFGEGDTARSEQVIQDLLAEAAGSRAVNGGLVSPAATGAEAAAAPAQARSDETYLGYLKASGFASPEGIAGDQARNYSIPTLRLNRWGLSGNWTVGAEHATLNRSNGSIAYRFSARDLHLVLGPGPAGKPLRFRVTIDGKAPGADHGADIDAEGTGVVSQTGLYQLVRQAGDVRERSFEVQFLDPGAQAYAFTFG